MTDRYPPGSAHESCPAATGDQADCTHFPDAAHRCGQPRGHMNDGPWWHICTCAAEWTVIVRTTPTVVKARHEDRE